MSQSSLLPKIRLRLARIGIVGLGYVGLPLAVLASQKGYRVTGMLRSKEKVDKLTSGKTEIDTVDTNALYNALATKKLLPRLLSSSELQNQDIIIICVPTPVTHDKKPDLSAMKAVTHEISKANLTNQL